MLLQLDSIELDLKEPYPGIYLADCYIKYPSYIFAASLIKGNGVSLNKDMALIKAKSEAIERYCFFSQPAVSIRYCTTSSDADEKDFFCEGYNQSNEKVWVPLGNAFSFCRFNTSFKLFNSKGFAAHDSLDKSIKNGIRECLECFAEKEMWVNSNYKILDPVVFDKLEDPLKSFINLRDVISISHQDGFGCYTTAIFDFCDRGVLVSAATDICSEQSLQSAVLELVMLLSNYDDEKFSVVKYSSVEQRNFLKEDLQRNSQGSIEALDPIKGDFSKVPYVWLDRTLPCVEREKLFVTQVIVSGHAEAIKCLLNYRRSGGCSYPLY